MRKFIAGCCCLFVLAGCSSTNQPEPEAAAASAPAAAAAPRRPASRPAPAVAEIQTSLEDAALRVTRALAMEQVSLKTIDRSAGVFQGTGSFAGREEWFDCPQKKGRLESQDYRITIVLRPSTSNGTVVELAVIGTEERYAYRRFVVFRTSRVFSTYPCSSTGALERSILQRINVP